MRRIALAIAKGLAILCLRICIASQFFPMNAKVPLKVASDSHQVRQRRVRNQCFGHELNPLSQLQFAPVVPGRTRSALIK